MQSEGYFQAEIRKIVNKQFMNMYSALLRSPVTVFPKGIITGVLDQWNTRLRFLHDTADQWQALRILENYITEPYDRTNYQRT